MDVAAELLVAPQLAPLDHLPPWCSRAIADDARGEEQALDVVAPVEVQGQLDHLLDGERARGFETRLMQWRSRRCRSWSAGSSAARCSGRPAHRRGRCPCPSWSRALPSRNCVSPRRTRRRRRRTWRRRRGSQASAEGLPRSECSWFVSTTTSSTHAKTSSPTGGEIEKGGAPAASVAIETGERGSLNDRQSAQHPDRHGRSAIPDLPPEPWRQLGSSKRRTSSGLRERGVVFDSAYCNSPLVRAVTRLFMSGMLPSNTGVYDNAAEFAADIPTFAHYCTQAVIRPFCRARCISAGPISCMASSSG